MENSIEVSADLYKDLITYDDEGYAWVPSIVNHPDLGMVYIEGTDVENWAWAAVKMIPIEEDEKQRFAEGQTMKPDMVNRKFFDKSYMDALEHLDFFAIMAAQMVDGSEK